MKLSDYCATDIINGWKLITRLDNPKYVQWVCKHTCGLVRTVYLHNLIKEKPNSCSCTKTSSCDGDSCYEVQGTRLYKIFRGMIARCTNPSRNMYHKYGGRGIKVLFSSYREFKTWALSSGYREDLTIERIDNNGNYEPSNCKWIPIAEQAYNRTTTKIPHKDIPSLYEEFIKTSYGKKKDLAKRYNCTYGNVLFLITKYKESLI